MNMTRLNIQISVQLKQQLDAKRSEGYTASGYIRSLLEREFNNPSQNVQRGR